ncbi:hypothetical protein ACFBZI_08650 [Moraxella sp. ZJ142]|uniref:hypothetical protein n=1 Tax=Moraxella marmotae TaxID=3344520 RepID=UPI0035D4CE3F
MNFNINFDKWLTTMLEKYEKSPKVRYLINFLAFTLFLYVLGGFIAQVKWW